MDPGQATSEDHDSLTLRYRH